MNTTSTQTSSENIFDERLQKYMGARYGQRGYTRQLYESAIHACSDIAYLSKTLAEVAHEFGHQPEAFRMMMKRHFPEVLAERERLRQLLGYSKKMLHGLRECTRLKYEPALKLLRSSDITIREAAEKTGVSLASLQQYIIFYHKDLAAERLKRRAEALDKPRKFGMMTATGATSHPRGDIDEFYAKAVELLTEHPELPVRQVAVQTGVSEHNLSCYMRRWHRDVLKMRQEWRRERTAKRQLERSINMSRTERAKKKYGPALELIEQGMTYREAAKESGINEERLQWWVRHNRPDIHERARENRWVMMPDGTRIMRRSWLLFQEATFAFQTSDEPINRIAIRFGLKEKAFRRFLNEKFPTLVAKRRARKKPKK